MHRVMFLTAVVCRRINYLRRGIGERFWNQRLGAFLVICLGNACVQTADSGYLSTYHHTSIAAKKNSHAPQSPPPRTANRSPRRVRGSSSKQRRLAFQHQRRWIGASFVFSRGERPSCPPWVWPARNQPPHRSEVPNCLDRQIPTKSRAAVLGPSRSITSANKGMAPVKRHQGGGRYA